MENYLHIYPLLNFLYYIKVELRQTNLDTVGIKPGDPSMISDDIIFGFSGVAWYNSK